MAKDYGISFKLPTPNRYFWHTSDYFGRIIERELTKHYRTPMNEKQSSVFYELITKRVPNEHARCNTPKYEDSWKISFERADGSKGESKVIIYD